MIIFWGDGSIEYIMVHKSTESLSVGGFPSRLASATVCECVGNKLQLPGRAYHEKGKFEGQIGSSECFSESLDSSSFYEYSISQSHKGPSNYNDSRHSLQR